MTQKKTRDNRRRRPHLGQAQKRQLGLEVLESRLLLTSAWQNYCDPLDVSADGTLSPRDALLTINYINHGRDPLLPTPSEDLKPAPFYDTSGDGRATPRDALLVINSLNAAQRPPRPVRTFSHGLGDWLSRESGGTSEQHGDVQVTNCMSVLREGDSFLVELATDFEAPASPSIARLTYDSLSFANDDDTLIKDAFEVVVMNEQGLSLVQTIARSSDAAFNASGGEEIEVGVNTRHLGQTIEIDLSHVPAGTQAELVAH